MLCYVQLLFGVHFLIYNWNEHWNEHFWEYSTILLYGGYRKMIKQHDNLYALIPSLPLQTSYVLSCKKSVIWFLAM